MANPERLIAIVWWHFNGIIGDKSSGFELTYSCHLFLYWYSLLAVLK
jgi:hypothetical protein